MHLQPMCESKWLFAEMQSAKNWGLFKLSFSEVPSRLNNCPRTHRLLEAPFWQCSEICSCQTFLFM